MRAQQWHVRRYELPFVPHVSFCAELLRESSLWDIQLCANSNPSYTKCIDVALPCANNAVPNWVAFEGVLNKLVEDVCDALHNHSICLLTQTYNDIWYDVAKNGISTESEE